MDVPLAAVDPLRNLHIAGGAARVESALRLKLPIVVGMPEKVVNNSYARGRNCHDFQLC
jgi:hypothetical protein